jgi:hypothetical protein
MRDPEDIYLDPDEVREARLWRRSYRAGCVCGTDLPGRCPGRENCPYAQEEEDEELQ